MIYKLFRKLDVISGTWAFYATVDAEDKISALKTTEYGDHKICVSPIDNRIGVLLNTGEEFAALTEVEAEKLAFPL